MKNLGINSEFGIHLSFDNEEDEVDKCSRLKSFIDENRYPIIKKLDLNYLSKIEKDKKLMLIAAILKTETTHINFLNTFFHNIAVKNRKFIFSYIDTQEDYHLLKYFNLKSGDLPKIIIYDFSQGKYFIDNYSYLSDTNAMIKLNELIEKIQNNNIKWTTGYFIEDLLSNLGINISRTSMTIIFLGFVAAFFITLILICCSLIDRGIKKDKVKKN